MICAETKVNGGPENIFWPQGQAPHGDYEVSVHYYSECGNEGRTSYEVTILVDGRTWSTEGVISPYETQHVRTFTR